MSVKVIGFTSGQRLDAGVALCWSDVNGSIVLRLLGLEPADSCGAVPVWRARRAVMWARGTMDSHHVTEATHAAHLALGHLALGFCGARYPATAYLAEQVERFAAKVEQLAAAGADSITWRRREHRRKRQPGR